MYTVCLRYASDSLEADDFLQEGFIRVFEKIGSYRGEGSFKGWVRKIMVNTCLQFIRKKRSLFTINEEVTKEYDYDISEGETKLDNEDLIKMIQRLPVNQRTVFNLYAIEGYSHQEISVMTGIPENTTKSHLHRARMALKEMIQRKT